ncbi:unnamed protein product [Calypogeia fissa]
MATLSKFGSIFPTDTRWRDPFSRKLAFRPSFSLRMAAREPRLALGVLSSKEVSFQEQHLQDMADLSACSESDGLERVTFPSLRLALERTEERSVGGRREFMAASFLLSCACHSTWVSTEAAAAAEDTMKEIPLELYSDIKDGFTLMRPVPWNKVDKPGASIFFEDPESRSNNIGVTVAPVRIASLNGFGTVDDIVKKLVKAERDKPSTNDVQIITVLERKVRDNIPLYSLEYTLDTTRGSKRVLTSVTIASYKLYILNIIFADGPVAPASQGLNDALHQVLNSFELLA